MDYSLNIGVVIFSKNEEKTIGPLIDRVTDFVNLKDIFVVDGNSVDRTAKIAGEKNIPVFFDEGKGKGSAIRLALRKIKREILVFMDSDGSHRPEEICILLEPFKHNNDIDMVIGSRFKGGREEFYGSIEEIIRYIGNILSTLLINAIWHAHLTDTQNGFRAVRRDAIQGLALVENSFSIEQEMVIKCLKAKGRIREVPSLELKRAYNRSHIIPFKMLPKYILCLARNIF